MDLVKTIFHVCCNVIKVGRCNHWDIFAPQFTTAKIVKLAFYHEKLLRYFLWYILNLTIHAPLVFITNSHIKKTPRVIYDCFIFVPKCQSRVYTWHDDVIKWKHFPRNWPFVRKIHRSPVNFPHKGQWRGALMFSLIYVWINDWANNREAGDLRRQHGHYDVIVMIYGSQICKFYAWRCLNTWRLCTICKFLLQNYPYILPSSVATNDSASLLWEIWLHSKWPTRSHEISRRLKG